MATEDDQKQFKLKSTSLVGDGKDGPEDIGEAKVTGSEFQNETKVEQPLQVPAAESQPKNISTDLPQEETSGEKATASGAAGSVEAGFETTGALATAAVGNNIGSQSSGGDEPTITAEPTAVVTTKVAEPDTATTTENETPENNDPVVDDTPADDEPTDDNPPIDDNPTEDNTPVDLSLSGEIVINEIGLGVGTSVVKHGNDVDIINEDQNFIELQNIAHNGTISASTLDALSLEIVGEDGATLTAINLADATGMSAVPAKAFMTIYEDGTWVISKPGGGDEPDDIKDSGRFEDDAGNPISFDWNWGEDTTAPLGVNLVQTDKDATGSLDLFVANGADKSVFTGGETAWDGDTFNDESGEQQVFARVLADADTHPMDTNTTNDWITSDTATERSFNYVLDIDDIIESDDEGWFDNGIDIAYDETTFDLWQNTYNDAVVAVQQGTEVED